MSTEALLLLVAVSVGLAARGPSTGSVFSMYSTKRSFSCATQNLSGFLRQSKDLCWTEPTPFGL